MSDNLPVKPDHVEDKDWRPASGKPASGLQANGSWEPFTPGPEGTAVEASKTAKELGKMRKELARHTYNSIHEQTVQKLAKLQLDVIDRAMASNATEADKLKALDMGEKVLDRLLGKPTQHTEGQHSVNIVSALKNLANAD